MGYALLPNGAKYAEWQQACAALNKIHLTVEDAEEGFDLIRYGKVDEPALAAYLTRFQDVAPEMVIATLKARFYMLSEAENSGVDLKIKQPTVYISMLTGPLFPEDFGMFR